MELANHWPEAEIDPDHVRSATPDDSGNILKLLRQAPYRHVHVDWRLPVDWVGQPGFVVAPLQDAGRAGTLRSQLFGGRGGILGCLAATADPPPAAWVRVAGLSRAADGPALLAAMLAHVEPVLRDTAVTELGWMHIEKAWPIPWFHQLGFQQSHQIETYLKSSKSIPPYAPPADLHIRPMQRGDIEALAAIEVAAFAPLWRHSSQSLTLARRQTISFDVALLGEELVGFQFSTHSRTGAHLARMTVKPEVQGRGVGSALLAHAIAGYHERGLTHISLNTQSDNYPSQRLYQKFGFYQSGDILPVWVKTIAVNKS